MFRDKFTKFPDLNYGNRKKETKMFGIKKKKTVYRINIRFGSDFKCTDNNNKYFYSRKKSSAFVESNLCRPCVILRFFGRNL